MRGVPDMPSKIRVTFRFKILLSVLIVVTTVVSLITFTMARMFHADKVAYVEDLVSLVSVHAAEEANLRLTAYQDQLVTAGRVLDATNILRERRDEALRNLFTRSPGLVALRVFENRRMVRLLLDSLAIGAVGVGRGSFLAAIARQAIPFDSIPRKSGPATKTTLTLSLPLASFAASTSSRATLSASPSKRSTTSLISDEVITSLSPSLQSRSAALGRKGRERTSMNCSSSASRYLDPTSRKTS